MLRVHTSAYVCRAGLFGLALQDMVKVCEVLLFCWLGREYTGIISWLIWNQYVCSTTNGHLLLSACYNDPFPSSAFIKILRNTTNSILAPSCTLCNLLQLVPNVSFLPLPILLHFPSSCPSCTLSFPLPHLQLLCYQGSQAKGWSNHNFSVGLGRNNEVTKLQLP